MTELLPCPFCGGEAEMLGVKVPPPLPLLRCKSCLAETSVYATEAEAIAAWNTRAERTCEVLGEDYDELLEYWETELSCGHVYNGMAQYVNYCPKCGAKVTPKCSETTPKVVDE